MLLKNWKTVLKLFKKSKPITKLTPHDETFLLQASERWLQYFHERKIDTTKHDLKLIKDVLMKVGVNYIKVNDLIEKLR